MGGFWGGKIGSTTVTPSFGLLAMFGLLSAPTAELILFHFLTRALPVQGEPKAGAAKTPGR
jgi:hypothetical protein